MEEKRTEISEIGEFGLIDKIKKYFPLLQKSTLLGIGDDAAEITGKGENILISSDMLVEGIHFDLTYMPLPHLGYKAISINISDIAAMYGTPEQILVNIGISNRFSVEAIEALYQGIRAACKDFNVDLVGGDTVSSPGGLILSITAIGRTWKGKTVKRDGAKKDDIICVTGDLGASYIGLQVLEREKREFSANPKMQPKLTDYEYPIQRQLKPMARMDIVHGLRELNIVPTSMIDISDGLASELLHIGKSSGVGIKIFEENLPIENKVYEVAIEFSIDPTTCILNGGEDYELLFTISQDDFKKIEKHPDIHFIGYIQSVSEENVLVTKERNVVPLTAQGWTHFRKQ